MHQEFLTDHEYLCSEKLRYLMENRAFHYQQPPIYLHRNIIRSNHNRWNSILISPSPHEKSFDSTEEPIPMDATSTLTSIDASNITYRPNKRIIFGSDFIPSEDKIMEDHLIDHEPTDDDDDDNNSNNNTKLVMVMEKEEKRMENDYLSNGHDSTQNESDDIIDRPSISSESERSDKLDSNSEPSNDEHLSKSSVHREGIPLTWIQVVRNVMLQLGEERSQSAFHVSYDLCPYIDQHWNELFHEKTRTATWQRTLSSTLTTHPEIFLKIDTGIYMLQEISANTDVDTLAAQYRHDQPFLDKKHRKPRRRRSSIMIRRSSSHSVVPQKRKSSSSIDEQTGIRILFRKMNNDHYRSIFHPVSTNTTTLSNSIDVQIVFTSRKALFFHSTDLLQTSTPPTISTTTDHRNRKKIHSFYEDDTIMDPLDYHHHYHHPHLYHRHISRLSSTLRLVSSCPICSRQRENNRSSIHRKKIPFDRIFTYGHVHHHHQTNSSSPILFRKRQSSRRNHIVCRYFDDSHNYGSREDPENLTTFHPTTTSTSSSSIANLMEKVMVCYSSSRSFITSSSTILPHPIPTPTFRIVDTHSRQAFSLEEDRQHTFASLLLSSSIKNDPQETFEVLTTTNSPRTGGLPPPTISLFFTPNSSIEP